MTPSAWHFRSEGPQLTAFCRADGTRLSLGPTPQRLRAPELLDVKLTDVCSVGCAFCYQDSRPDRQHARLEDVAFIAAEAGKAGVFEVALGGGEVSEYPDFVEVLHLFRVAGVVPNFTTRRMRWLAREWATLRELVGGVAVSVGIAAEIRLLGSLIPVSQRQAGQLVAQVVMGTISRAELLTLMRAAGEAQIRVTLLGFKDVGRGQSYKPLDYGWWLDDLPQYVALTPVSIDTALAAECPETLERLLMRGSYHTEEGRFSAYVDAVNMTLAPSSYHAGPQFPFDAHWLEAFVAPDFVQGPATPPTQGRVRLGFATNSSSSHSLVLLKEYVPDDPADPKEWEEAFASQYKDFTASSLNARKYFLAANLMVDIQDSLNESPDLEVWVRKLTDLPEDLQPSKKGVDSNSSIQIIHQDNNSIELHPNILKRVKAVLYAPMVSVFGEGNSYEGDLARWQSVDFILDSANFIYMFTLSEIFEPVPEKSDDLSWPLYLLGLVRGERFLKVMQGAMANGIDWREAKTALLVTPQQNYSEPQKSRLLLKVLHAAGLKPPKFLMLEGFSYSPNENELWFRLYLKADENDLHEFMEQLEIFRCGFYKFSRELLIYAAFDLDFEKLKPETLPKLTRAMQMGQAFLDAINIDNEFGLHTRIDEFLEGL